MPRPEEPIDALNEGLKEGADDYKEMVRSMRDEVILRPLIGEKATKEERLAALLNLTVVPDNLLATHAEMAQKLPPERPISRNLLEALERGFKDLNKLAEESGE